MSKNEIIEHISAMDEGAPLTLALLNDVEALISTYTGVSRDTALRTPEEMISAYGRQVQGYFI